MKNIRLFIWKLSVFGGEIFNNEFLDVAADKAVLTSTYNLCLCRNMKNIRLFIWKLSVFGGEIFNNEFLDVAARFFFFFFFFFFS